MANNKGWVPLYRSICDTWLYKDKPFNRVSAMTDLLIMANHSECVIFKDGVVTKVRRGSFVTSEQILMNRWGWGKEKVRRFLRQIEDCGWITRKVDRRGTVITVRNYGADTFEDQTTGSTQNQTTGSTQNQTIEQTATDAQQIRDSKECQTAKQTTDRLPTVPPTDYRPYTNNNVNNYKNGNNEEKGRREPAHAVHYYGLHENVPLTVEEYEKYKTAFPTVYEKCITSMSSRILGGKNYSDVLGTLWKWGLEDEGKQSNDSTTQRKTGSQTQFITGGLSDELLEAIEKRSIKKFDSTAEKNYPAT